MNSRPSFDRVETHPFVSAPHRTVLRLSAAVLISLVAEPLAAIADTAFVARLGPESLSALGASTIVLSAVFWIFNFLGIGTQTEVARALGRRDLERASAVSATALVLAVTSGVVLGGLGLATVEPLMRAMGTEGEVLSQAETYLAVRWLGAPAIVAMTTAFGALRGLQDMRTPLWIAVGASLLNVGLDALLIFGAGPIPALHVAGAAWATVASQWVGAAAAVLIVRRRLGLRWRPSVGDVRVLLMAGRDLFLRTALLSGFLVLTTRAATRISPEAGAVHQVIRQTWMLGALFLDAFAATAQSLVGYYLGAARIDIARRVSGVSVFWCVVAGVALALSLHLARPGLERFLVPGGTFGGHTLAFLVAVWMQPLSAVSFATDGIHWGTRDYAYLRNAMAASTGLAVLALFGLEAWSAPSLMGIWVVTAGWVSVRGLLGALRVWPGVGRAPLRREASRTRAPGSSG